ncbi:MAG: hypothetical protein ACRENJ_08215 [Candidatus Eiseniibacteriota bacterium]
MRRLRCLPHRALVVAIGLVNGGCILIPEIEHRIVELAVGGTTVVEFVSNGTINNHDETSTVNILDGFDLAQILADAGVDVSNVTNIALAGIEYRVTVPDPEASRQIVDGTVTIRRGLGLELPLISGFNAGAGAVTGWQVAPLDPSGAAVALINSILNDIRGELPLSPPPDVTTITYHVTGQSVPANIATNFTWELKIKITITGTVQVSVPT